MGEEREGVTLARVQCKSRRELTVVKEVLLFGREMSVMFLSHFMLLHKGNSFTTVGYLAQK